MFVYANVGWRSLSNLQTTYLTHPPLFLVILILIRWFDEKNLPILLAFLLLFKRSHSLRRITMRLLRSFEQKQKFSAVLVISLRQITLKKG